MLRSAVGEYAGGGEIRTDCLAPWRHLGVAIQERAFRVRDEVDSALRLMLANELVRSRWRQQVIRDRNDFLGLAPRFLEGRNLVLERTTFVFFVNSYLERESFFNREVGKGATVLWRPRGSTPF
jgi:hypothetical protein